MKICQIEKRYFFKIVLFNEEFKKFVVVFKVTKIMKHELALLIVSREILIFIDLKR